ncbi:MAG: Rne/Rng family ribonuclease [Acidobacteriaceae bacterium]
MSKEIYISSTPHETRLAIVEDDNLSEIYYERENEYTLAGSIYKGRVTRVLPGMQSSFVDIGLERDAFLYVTDFMEEAGDSADFEAAPSVEGRTERGHERGGERGRDRRGDRGDRGDRNGHHREQHAPQAEATPEEAAAIEVPTETEAGEVGQGAPGADGTRRWRGRRGRRRGRSSAGQRSEAPSEQPSQQEQPQVLTEEEEFSPIAAEDILPEVSAGSYAPAPVETVAEPIPFVLPGESISKYRRGEDVTTAPAKAAPAFTAKPSTLVEAPLAWDGGLLLPGESLSRHRGAAPVFPAAAPAVSPIPVEPVAVAETGVAELLAETATDELVEATPAVEVAAETASVSESQAEPEPQVEYEPEEASASYKVDPVAPSEYRLTAVEEPIVEESVVAAPVVEEVQPEVVEEEQSSEPAAIAEEPAVEAVAEAIEAALVETVPAIEPEDVVSVEEIAEEAPVQTVVEEVSSSNGVVESPLTFAPGNGLIEEEIIDEEEYDFELIHAHADEMELDDLEEETLEGAADLGTMVRDMHLEERTRSNEPDSLDDEFGDTLVEDEEGFDSSLGEDTEDEEAVDEEAADEAISEEGEEGVAAGPAPERRGRRDGRRGDRRGGRRRGGPGGGGGGRGRQSVQATNLPAISELLKPGQEILVQIAKEPIAKKGARITSHIALPGRFLVFMPTVNHVGVSRKISSDEERHRLKRILLSEKGEATGGFIVRTAADGASEDELRSDLRFLINLWNDIKQRSDDSKAPALIYHDLNLVERILRDQVTDNFSAIWVDTEAEYERVLRFLQRFQPSLIRRVKLYTKETPLFEQFGIGEEINKALKSKVWLKSGGSIVINQTEALVAIDINTGKYVGKTARLEDTILKTNLDAIPEIVRQIRLRDLGGIIVIDFIDMDERKNRNKVMQALEEELKHDRAPSKVLQFNDFGLVAITRKRVKQSLERTLSTPCNICTGTGMVKSPVTVCNEIYIEMRKMQRHLDRGDVMLRVHPEVVKMLKSNTGRWLVEMEEMLGKTILVKSDPSLHPEQFDIH